MSNVKSAFVTDSEVLQAGGIASFCKSAYILPTSVMLCLLFKNIIMNFEKLLVVVMVLDEHSLRSLI